MKPLATALLLLCAIASFQAHGGNTNPYVGYWVMDFDEDGTPADSMEITASGEYINLGWQCQIRTVVPYHIHNNDLYVTVEVAKKGPTATIFRLLDDGRLSFTSPRTRNNAYYRRIERNPCPSHEG